VVRVALNADTWKLLVNPRTVTLSVRLDEGSSFADPATVTNAQRSGITRDDGAFPPDMLTEQQVTWRLWVAKLPGGVVPKVADVIVEGAVRWTVRAVLKAAQGASFRCDCQEER
jgi:hypothetical protein